MKRIMFICSTGGHLSEMMKLKPLFNQYESILITEKNPSGNQKLDSVKTHYLLYGTRKHLFTYLFKFGINCLKSIYYFIRYRPEYIITTGAHTAVPMVYIAKLFKRKVIFIESIARVKSMSLAGKLIQKKCDLVIVQWPTMTQVYANSIYGGQIL